MAPVVKELKKYPNLFDTKVCVTAQHRDMLDQVLSFFSINPEYDLDIMTYNQNLYSVTADIINKMKPVLEEVKPEYVLVHGDTTTSMATALAAFYFGAKVCHVEAGLRTYDKKAPFPEEMNRVLTGHIADIHFAPTARAKSNLLKESIADDAIVITGNTVIDALLDGVSQVRVGEYSSIETLNTQLDAEKDIVLITMHRRENHGEGLEVICNAILKICEQCDVQVVYPVHKNPNIYLPVHKLLGQHKNIKLIDPLPYEAFIWLMDKSKLIITDSGGIQEEAPSLGKPVLVLRNVTERPESVDAGTVILVGNSDANRIAEEAIDLLTNVERYEEMSHLRNPYGDGTASEIIVSYLKSLKD